LSRSVKIVESVNGRESLGGGSLSFLEVGLRRTPERVCAWAGGSGQGNFELVHRFRNNCIIHLSTNPIAQFKKPQRSSLRLRFLNCTLESVSSVNNTVIYETMY